MPIGMPAAISLLSTGGSIASNALGRRRNRIETVLTPEQQRLSGQLSGVLGRNLASPRARTASIQQNKILAKDRLNRSADAAIERSGENLAARGFGNSGLFERSVSGIEGARLQGLSSLEAAVLQQIENSEVDAEQRAIENVLRFLPGQGSRQSTYSGGVIGEGIGAGLDTLTTLLTVSQLVGGGGFNPGGRAAADGG